MKKTISLLMVMVFVIISFTACSQKNNNVNADGNNENLQITTEITQSENSQSTTEITQSENSQSTTEITQSENSQYTGAFEEYINVTKENSTYDYLIKEMYFSLADAFATGKLGTPTVITCVHGLVPESVYNNKNTPEEKMNAIYEYAMTDKLCAYFSTTRSSDGDVLSVDIKLGNIRKFIEDGIACGLFVGTWESFEFSSQITSIEQFSQKMNITNEVAIAFLNLIDSYDIEWLVGDKIGMLEQLS
ncbi:MAG: hypothetical protein IKY78_00260 [Clostridia bacterium]|nr:hypothetical protein [Clostridia bacterium]